MDIVSISMIIGWIAAVALIFFLLIKIFPPVPIETIRVGDSVQIRDDGAIFKVLDLKKNWLGQATDVYLGCDQWYTIKQFNIMFKVRLDKRVGD